MPVCPKPSGSHLLLQAFQNAPELAGYPFQFGIDFIQYSTVKLFWGQSFGRELPLTYFTDHSPVILEWRSGVSRIAPLVMSLTFSNRSRFSDTVIVAKADHEVFKSPIAHSLYLRNVNQEGLSGLLKNQ